jgi:small ligand-binding sensory domain FIST
MVIDERRDTFERGDFLVRSIVGAERATGGIAIAGEAELGTTAQFHVRDASTADEDLRLALAGPPADAALLFTCIARGMRLFGESDHDAREVHDAVGRGAVAGMFCDGEFGPVGLRSFVHGYTASVLLFGTAEDRRSATP